MPPTSPNRYDQVFRSKRQLYYPTLPVSRSLSRPKPHTFPGVHRRATTTTTTDQALSLTRPARARPASSRGFTPSVEFVHPRLSETEVERLKEDGGEGGAFLLACENSPRGSDPDQVRKDRGGSEWSTVRPKAIWASFGTTPSRAWQVFLRNTAPRASATPASATRAGIPHGRRHHSIVLQSVWVWHPVAYDNPHSCHRKVPK